MRSMMASATNDAVQVLCNFLSGAVIIVCLVLKMPQIVSVFKRKSSKGLNIKSILLELCGYTIMLTYHCAMNYPLKTYMEYCFLVPQDLVLLFLVLHFNKSLSAHTLAFLGLYLCVTYSLAFRLVPEAVLKTCISLVTPITMSSKLLQIVTLIRSKDAGALSSLTWAMASFGTMARSITTALLTGDMAVLLNFSVNFCLNSTMMLLVIFYQSKKKKDD